MFRIAAFVLAMLGSTPTFAVTTIEWWQPFAPESGNGKALATLAGKFNDSQTDYELVPVHKGSYVETLNAGIAAYRAGKAPAMLTPIARDAATMMTSGAVIPVHQLMTDQGITVDWSRFIPSVITNFSDDKGLVSMPFNTSTPILWYNLDAFEEAGLREPPHTWDELGEHARRLRAAGFDCGFVTSEQVWVHLDSYSAIQDLPIATRANGLEGWDAELIYNKTPFVDHVARLRGWLDEGLWLYAGRWSQGANEAFIAGKCPMMLNSSASYAGLKAGAKFPFAASYQPVEADNPDPKNSMFGGGSIFVLKGQPDEVYAGVAQFLEFMAEPEQQLFWHKQTGYVPVSLDAYEMARAEGYYEKFPHQEIAILQLSRGSERMTENTKGTRLGYASQVYEILDEELEAVWSAQKTPQAAMDDAVRRGNEALRRFERTVPPS